MSKWRSWLAAKLRRWANRIDPPSPDLWDYGDGEGVFGMRVVMDPTLPSDTMMLESPDGYPPVILTNIGPSTCGTDHSDQK